MMKALSLKSFQRRHYPFYPVLQPQVQHAVGVDGALELKYHPPWLGL